MLTPPNYFRAQQQLELGFNEELIEEGNTIKKAYLSYSKIKKLNEGDVIIFYRSGDEKNLTSIGIVDKIYPEMQDFREILHKIGRRSVYSPKEIAEFIAKPITIIMFHWHFHFPRPIPLKILQQLDVLKAAPQSIMEIEHEKYVKIKELGGLNERFTCH